MKVTAVTSDNPKPIANYTEAFRAGDLIFVAGQLATDFKTGVPPEAKTNPAFPYYGSDIKLQTNYILKNLQRTFAAAGSSLDHVIKAQVFLTDLDDFAGFDEVWRTFFKVPPARTTVQTTGLLVKDTLIEIDLVGYVPRPGLDVRVIKSGLPAPIAHYTEAFVLVIWSTPRDNWRPTSRSEYQRAQKRSRPFRFTGRTSSYRPNSSSGTWQLPLPQQEVRLITSSRHRSF